MNEAAMGGPAYKPKLERTRTMTQRTCGDISGLYVFRKAGYVECPVCGMRVDIRNMPELQKSIKDYRPIPSGLIQQIHIIDVLGGWDYGS